MEQDLEIKALRVIHNALFVLDSEARQRVVEWIIERFGQKLEVLKSSKKDNKEF